MLPEDATYVFDIGARVNCDHITVLHPQVVADNSVYPSRAIVEIVIGKDN